LNDINIGNNLVHRVSLLAVPWGREEERPWEHALVRLANVIFEENFV